MGTSDPLVVLCAVLRGGLRALPRGDDSVRVLECARQHRVHFLAAWRLGLGPRALQQFANPFFEDLANEIRVESLRDELRVREVARVVEALEHEGHAPVVFKGAALAHTHYAESWLRPRLDTDLLVSPSRREAVFRALEGLGYQRVPFVSGEHVMHQVPFVRIDDQGFEHVLDLHWQIANAQAVARVLTHEEIVARAGVAQVRGLSVRVPSPPDALLLACVHRAAHHDDSDELLWLYDIHLLAVGLTPEEWATCADVACARKVAALCARGLALAQARFGTVVPPVVLDRLGAGGGGAELSAVYLRKGLRRVDRLAADLRALGPRAGLGLLREHLFPPARYMEQAYGVRRRALLPAFYARRILSGVSKWLGPPRRA